MLSAKEAEKDMDVRLIEEPGRRAIEVRVLAAPGDARAATLARRIGALAGRVSGYPVSGGTARRVVPLAEVVLFELVAGRVRMILRSGEELEPTLRLFEVEAALADSGFVRISRQALANFDMVVEIRPEVGGRLALELEGGRRALVTRTYVREVRRMLGMGCGR